MSSGNLPAPQAQIGLMVCDEGHRLKSSAGNQTIDALCKVGGGACKRLVLTGTPMQNDLTEFWAMAEFASPGALPPLAEFRATLAQPIEEAQRAGASEEQASVAGGVSPHPRGLSPAASPVTRPRRGGQVSLAAERQQELLERSAAFMQVRGRDVLDKLLPARRELVVCCALSEAQRASYTAALALLRELQESGGGGGGPEHLSAIMRLRSICSSGRATPRDEDGAACDGSPTSAAQTSAAAGEVGKAATLLGLMPAVAAAGDRVVVCCQFQSSLDLIEAGLARLGLGSVRIDGKVPKEKRQELVNRFNAPHSRETAFLLSTKAGGTGFNLTSANRLVLFDPDWNPATDKQAAGRVFRDGQTRDVTIWRLLSAGTLEEKMFQRQVFKGDLADASVGGGGGGGRGGGAENRFSRDELRALFEYDPAERCETLRLLLRAAGCEAEAEGRAAPESWLREATPARSPPAPRRPTLLTPPTPPHPLQMAAADPVLCDALRGDPALCGRVTFATDVTLLLGLRAKASPPEGEAPRRERAEGGGAASDSPHDDEDAAPAALAAAAAPSAASIMMPSRSPARPAWPPAAPSRARPASGRSVSWPTEAEVARRFAAVAEEEEAHPAATGGGGGGKRLLCDVDQSEEAELRRLESGRLAPPPQERKRRRAIACSSDESD